MVLALCGQSRGQSELSAHAAVDAAADARLHYDRRDKYFALERAGVFRGGMSSLRQLSTDCEGLVAGISRGWAEEIKMQSRARVEGALNEATRGYQHMLEANAIELATQGDFMLGGKILESEADFLKYRMLEAQLVAKKGPFRVQDEQPMRVALKEATFRDRNAWRERMESGGPEPILGHHRLAHARPDDTLASSARPGGDVADVAARQYMHVRRIRDGPPKPVRAQMHQGSRARYQFRP